MRIIAGVLIWLGLLGSVFGVVAKERVALVIGIDNYREVGNLANALNDARAVAQTLKDLGFRLIQGWENPSKLQLARMLQELKRNIRAGDTVLVYFAGHGVSIDGANYLLPSDVPAVTPDNEFLISEQSISLQRVLGLLESSKSKLNIVILDACRENPFSQGVGSSQGLAHVDPPDSTMIMFSAGPNQLALDRLSDDEESRNSVYTRVLLELMKNPGVELTSLARQVKRRVHELAQRINHPQRPHYVDGYLGNFCFKPGESNSCGRVLVADSGKGIDPADKADFEAARLTNSIEAYEHYLSTHPDGAFKTDAHGQIDFLKYKQLSDEMQAYEKAKKCGSRDCLETYQKKYPQGRYIAQVARGLTAAKLDVTMYNGVYEGKRGYIDQNRPSPDKWCRAQYDVAVAINNGDVAFESDGRTWRGTIDKFGAISFDRSGVTPKPKRSISITGPLEDAVMTSGYCGKGYFRVAREDSWTTTVTSAVGETGREARRPEPGPDAVEEHEVAAAPTAGDADGSTVNPPLRTRTFRAEETDDHAASGSGGETNSASSQAARETTAAAESAEVEIPQRRKANATDFDGIYTGSRGYTDPDRKSPDRECKPDYPLTVYVRNGQVEFRSDGRVWIGSVDTTGKISLDRSGVIPAPKHPIAITGPLDDAQLESGFCGKGFFKVSRLKSK